SFNKEEYWTIDVFLETPDKKSLKAKYVKSSGKKTAIPDEETAKKIIEGFRKEPFNIRKIETKKVSRKPSPPFITSTLQQDASIRLGFSPSKTMLLAQKLYEGIELGREGSIGLITYMRTDSFRVSDDAMKALRNLIAESYGTEFLPNRPRLYSSKSKGKIQDAHECIRPTYLDRSPESVEKYLPNDQFKLYRLIWNRTVASQMNDAAFNQTSVKIHAGIYEFASTGRVMTFPGFMKIWEDVKKNGNGDDAEELTSIPPGLKENMPLTLVNENPEQHFTQPPPRFTESSLVKELDQLGIGRPSTYALTVSTLQNRKYVKREKRRLSSTELGELVNKIVVNHFPDIFNVNFTASMETELDQIETGRKKYKDVLNHFYHPFQQNIDKVLNKIKDIKKSLEEKSGVTCEKCGRDMVVKWGKFGKFYACSGFPECKNILEINTDQNKKQEPEKAGFTCEKCGLDMVVRQGKYGKFYACSGYPKCKNIVEFQKDKKPRKQAEKADFACEKCGRDMVVRQGKFGKFYACSGYPKCKNIVNIKVKSNAKA
ncbi:type I DNA topoisomerase, partial [candidate division KSB1 bacterium]